MTDPSVRSVRLTRVERSVIRLALQASIDHYIDVIPDQVLLDSVIEISTQAQAALDAYTVLTDDVVSKEHALTYAAQREAAMQYAYERWIASRPTNPVNVPDTAKDMLCPSNQPTVI